MVAVSKILSTKTKKRVFVIGDFMLDRYVIGSSKRISPEAPVPVVHVSKEKEQLGGAGNVVLNLIALGIDPVISGKVGNDVSGVRLRHLLEKEGLSTEGLVEDASYQTPTKCRIVAGHQQIVRVDYESKITQESDDKQLLIQAKRLLRNCDVVAISDYGKGTLTKNSIQEIIQEAKKHHIPVLVDPKGTDFSKYSGATLIKPNRTEAMQASGCPENTTLELAAKKILQEVLCDQLMVTRSEEGISLYFQDGSFRDFPVVSKAVTDVTGAGDTVLAVISMAYAYGLSLDEAAVLSNIAASIAIERVGCVSVTLGEIVERVIDTTHPKKVFTHDEQNMLSHALFNKAFVIVECCCHEVLSTSFFKVIEALQEKYDRIVISMDQEHIKENTLVILSQLSFIDYILIGKWLDTTTVPNEYVTLSEVEQVCTI